MESLLFEPDVDFSFRKPDVGLDFNLRDQPALQATVNYLHIDFEKGFFGYSKPKKMLRGFLSV